LKQCIHGVSIAASDGVSIAAPDGGSIAAICGSRVAGVSYLNCVPSVWHAIGSHSSRFAADASGAAICGAQIVKGTLL